MTVTKDNNADQSVGQEGDVTGFEETAAPCLFCGSESSKVLFTFNDPGGREYRLRGCQNCQARFIDPTPTQDELARTYDAAYYGKGTGKFSGPVEAILDRFRRGRAVRLAKPGAGIGYRLREWRLLEGASCFRLLRAPRGRTAGPRGGKDLALPIHPIEDRHTGSI